MFANAKAYEQFMGRWSRLMAARLIEFAKIADEGHLLDIGLGTGSLSFEVVQRKKNVHVVGIDPSTEFIEYSNGTNPEPDRVKFEIGDARRLPFPDATFDSSLSMLVFNFIPDPLQALQQACRVTRSGGVIAAAVWDYGGEMRMLRSFWDAAASIDQRAGDLDEARMPLCRPGELSDLWVKVGLISVVEQPLDIQMRFLSFEDYWHPFLLQQGPAGAYVSRLDADTLERLKAELRRRLSVSKEDVPFVLPARAWAIRGTVPVKNP
jgi:SAM-dependent methyltransferase